MILDTDERIDLTGPWAGFGFQRGKLFTPEGFDLEPHEMAHWSLVCGIAREWREMMAEAALERGQPWQVSRTPNRQAGPNIIYLRDALRKRVCRGGGRRFAGRAQVVRSTRGPMRYRRG